MADRLRLRIAGCDEAHTRGLSLARRTGFRPLPGRGRYRPVAETSDRSRTSRDDSLSAEGLTGDARWVCGRCVHSSIWRSMMCWATGRGALASDGLPPDHCQRDIVDVSEGQRVHTRTTLPGVTLPSPSTPTGPPSVCRKSPRSRFSVRQTMPPAPRRAGC